MFNVLLSLHVFVNVHGDSDGRLYTGKVLYSLLLPEIIILCLKILTAQQRHVRILIEQSVTVFNGYTPIRPRHYCGVPDNRTVVSRDRGFTSIHLLDAQK